MTFLCVGDVHLSDKPPSSCTDSYTDDLFDLLIQVRELSNREEALTVFSGDIFHHKAPSKTSHRLVQRFIEYLRGFVEPPRIVVGNHDISNDRLESLEKQPLGTVFASGAALPGFEGESLSYQGANLGFVSWQRDWPVWAADKRGLTEVDENEVPVEIMGDLDEGLMVAHAPLYPPGQELTFEFVDSDDFARRLMLNHCYYGHVHERHGVWQNLDKSHQVTFCNSGALSRGSLAEHDLTRSLKVALWEKDSGFMEVDLEHRPAEEVFKLDEHHEVTQTRAKLDEFTENVGQSIIESVTADDLKADIMALEHIPEDVRLLAIELIAGAAA